MLIRACQDYQRFWLEDSLPEDHEPTEQLRVVAQMQSFYASHPDVFLRSYAPGHFTGSALVFDHGFQQLALTHHKKLGLWLQFGGHADGDRQLQRVAFREAEEESGLQQIEFGSQLGELPLDLDIHEIPAWKTEPAHLHYDFCYLLTAPYQQLQLSDESNQVRWFSWDELSALEIDHALRRRLTKVRYLLSNPAKRNISSETANPALSSCLRPISK